jgi:ribosome-associated heat shock protein Hsp15
MATDTVRVDSWLWAVRVFKTRSAATAACRAGHVKVNSERAKAAQPLKIGDEVRVRIAGFDRVLEVRHTLAKRVAATVAATSYVDNSPPLPTPEETALLPQRDRGAGRPTKRELDRLLGRD